MGLKGNTDYMRLYNKYGYYKLERHSAGLRIFKP